VFVDGIKPTLSDLKDDPTPVYDPVKMNLLNPSGPNGLEPTAPTPSRVAPITPPFHATPESNVEIVQNDPEPTPEPMPIQAIPVPDRVNAPAPIHDIAPAAPVAQDAPAVVATTPMTQPKSGKGLAIGIIVALLLLAAAAAAYYFLVYKKPVAIAPASIAVTAGTPTSLVQQGTKAALTAGATVNTPPILGASLVTTANSGSVALEVEVEPLATAFTGVPTVTGQVTTANGSTLKLSASPGKLADGSYHWQARTKVGISTSAWVTNSPVGSTKADFVISTVAPTAPVVSAVAGGTISGTAVATTQNQPLISGTTAPGSTLSITVTPDNITLTPNVAASGSWSVTPSQQLANGAHTLAFTTTDAAGNHSQASYTLTINPVVAAAPAPATPAVTTPVTTKLAPTGDPTLPLTLVALAAGLASVAGLVYLRRYDQG
jgi:hypothetical protein